MRRPEGHILRAADPVPSHLTLLTALFLSRAA
jgi:hypothetical protein